ncbi:hypothetical protein BT93_L1022 [Corymbia citriodora subsp. variegata]|uniref:Uncharacterized protein n=1 Tax=Corymbia citriodora subsp. variegata TaxID=360336 RepID=A0A8T0CNY7_CORYI|nr:hypothetical protein BT93_L1022 [Corymbia citriodora subsp. variegata]
MEAYVKTRTKMKRKDLDQVSDDFSDFSLSSPARKIRRLDAELPPIMEDDEPEIAMPDLRSDPGVLRNRSGCPVIEELPTESALASSSASAPENEERAIVLFKPVHGRLQRGPSPSSFSVSVDPDFISGFKSQFYWSNEPAHEKLIEDETDAAETNKGGTNCMAMVPWIPSQFPPASGIELLQTEGSEAMEAEETGDGTMEIEDANESYQAVQEQAHGYAGQSASEGFQQWQQPHCMTPQPPHSVSTPLVWYR